MIRKLKEMVALVALCGTLHGTSAYAGAGASPFVLDGAQVEGLKAVKQAIQRAGNAFEKANYPEYSRAFFELVSIEGELASMRMTVDEKISFCFEIGWRLPCQDRAKHKQLLASLDRANEVVVKWRRKAQDRLNYSGPISERELALLHEQLAGALEILDTHRRLYDALFPQPTVQ